MNTETQVSPGIGALDSKFAQLGGCIIDVVGTNGKRVTAQISAGRMFRGWVPMSSPWIIVGATSFDGTAISTALGGAIAKANIRITLYDGDSGSPNPVYVAMFGAGNFPYLRSPSQVANYDFDGGTNLHFGFAKTDGTPVLIGAMGAAATARLDASGVTIDTFTGFPGLFALTDPKYSGVPKPSRYLVPVQPGVAPGVWPATGWFTVPDISLGDLYDVLATGMISVGLNDISPGDQYFDFTQGLATDVIDIPFNATVPPQTSWLDLWVWRELFRFTSLDQDLNFPPGYAKALMYALSLEFFPEYPAAAEKYDLAELAAEADEALKDLEILNSSDAVAMEPPV